MGTHSAGRRRTSAGRQRHPGAPRRPISPPDPNAPRRWRERVWFARVVRWVVLLVPLMVSFLVALWLSHALPVPDPFMARLTRWAGIAVVSTLVLLALQWAMRRLLPLAALLSLTLVFPDEAPSRFRIALRSYSARDLDRALHDVTERHHGTDAQADAQAAAERLLVLVGALSRHDRLTRGHSERVRAYSLMIGEEMRLAPDELDRLRWAGLLHDVGKMYVPAEILNKPGRLTDDEFAIVREHTTLGAALTVDLAGWLGDDVRAVDQHHERWAGGGYPSGIHGDQIVRAARIVAVADAFDVMTSARSYKKPMPATAARAELERCAGTQFDPAVVRAMLSISLGRLWRAMGPLSLIAQVRLFPQPAANGGAAAATAVAAGVAMAITAIAGFVAADPGQAAQVLSLPTGGASEPIATATPTTAAAAPSTSTSTTTSTTTSTSAPEGPVAVPTTRPVGPMPVATTTTIRRTNAATTTTRPPPPIAGSTTTTTPPTTTPATTATTTITDPPPPPTTSAAATTTTTTIPARGPVVLTLASSSPGDVSSQAILQLVAVRAPVNGGLPNYDVDRNADPGLTVLRSPEVLETPSPTTVQVWQLDADLTAVPATAGLTLSVAAAAPVSPGDELHVRAGLFDCDTSRAACTRLVRDTVALTSVSGAFSTVAFDLSVGTLTPLEIGHRLELRFAVLMTSDHDVWVGYDSASHPSALTLGP